MSRYSTSKAFLRASPHYIRQTAFRSRNVKSITPLQSSPVRRYASPPFQLDKGPSPRKKNPPLRTTLYFSIEDRPGSLETVLGKVREVGISLSRIESRPGTMKDSYNFFMDFTAENSDQLKEVYNHLKKNSLTAEIVSAGGIDTHNLPHTVPWFPRKKSDMDTFASKVMSYGVELEADHPGFKDPVYRKRREEITTIARTYKAGQDIPKINYTTAEIETWGLVFQNLAKLYKSHGCREHQYVLPLLEHNCGYSEDNIPQINDISNFLKDTTGWTLRPVMGLLSSRDFLNALAFRVFHSTQYIRHSSQPFYTPEPDVCHELLGHVPLFADQEFADFSQEIGLASLGASDSDLEKLATIYWFTVEFGLCRQNGELKAYGAGLLSSFGELEYSISDKPKHIPFDPRVAAGQKYPITSYQPVYFVAESFRDMKEQVRDYAAHSISRPFAVRYNSLTETVDILDSRSKVLRYAQNIKSEVVGLINAIEKMP